MHKRDEIIELDIIRDLTTTVFHAINHGSVPGEEMDRIAGALLHIIELQRQLAELLDQKDKKEAVA